jgi:dTDP-4-dehydrorhamnose reductase
MKVALTGSEGMLGTDLLLALKAHGHDVLSYTRDTLDITDVTQVNAVLVECAPEVVINCAGYTNVEGAEDDRDACHVVNTEGAQHLADYCAKHGVTLMQVSTDYVFDGQKKEYTEDDDIHPLNIYGASKAEAEASIRTTLKEHYIVRTAWLYGHHGKNFVETVLRVCEEQGAMQIVDDQRGCPTYTKDLAQAIADLIEKPYGTYHLINTGNATWYEFATRIVATAGISCTLTPCTSLDFPQKAKRPARSVLLNTKAAPLRSWEEAIQDYIANRPTS